MFFNHNENLYIKLNQTFIYSALKVTDFPVDVNCG